MLSGKKYKSQIAKGVSGCCRTVTYAIHYNINNVKNIIILHILSVSLANNEIIY